MGGDFLMATVTMSSACFAASVSGSPNNLLARLLAPVCSSTDLIPLKDYHSLNRSSNQQCIPRLTSPFPTKRSQIAYANGKLMSRESSYSRDRKSTRLNSSH